MENTTDKIEIVIENTLEKKDIIIQPKKKEKLFKIIIVQDSYSDFKEKIEKALNKGWKLHGYTQHPLQVSVECEYEVRDDGKKHKVRITTAERGQWSQAFTKNVI